MKHVALQHCHITQWHDGLKVLGRQGCHSRQHLYRTTSCGEQHSSTPCFPVGRCSTMVCVCELASKVGVCHKTVLHILQDILGYCKLAAHWIPHEISKVQLRHRYAVAQALLDQYQREGDDFLGWIVAMDETWACSYEPKLKFQSNEWKHPGSPHPKKVHPTQCAVKMMFIVAYDIDGIILHHAVLPRQTVNAAYYCRFLQHHLCPMLRRKQHLVVQNPIILHDNARSHTAAAVTDLFCRRQWEILEHPLYSPNMSPCDYDLFAKVK